METEQGELKEELLRFYPPFPLENKNILLKNVDVYRIWAGLSRKLSETRRGGSQFVVSFVVLLLLTHDFDTSMQKKIVVSLKNVFIF